MAGTFIWMPDAPGKTNSQSETKCRGTPGHLLCSALTAAVSPSQLLSVQLWLWTLSMSGRGEDSFLLSPSPNQTPYLQTRPPLPVNLFTLPQMPCPTLLLVCLQFAAPRLLLRDSISVQLVPPHVGVQGNEQADLNDGCGAKATKHAVIEISY